MRKTIAKRSNTSIGIFVLVCGMAILIIGIAIGTYCTNRDLLGAFCALLVFGVALFGYSAVLLVRIIVTPKTIIFREGDCLYFPKFSCMAWEISDISSVLLWSKYGDNRYGKLKLTARGKKWVFYNVENVEEVAQTLQRIAENVRPCKENNHG